MSRSSDDSLWTRRLLWLAAGVLLFRVLQLFTINFQVSGDEAYYFDWGRRPDWCYYSKPPLIGWLMAVIRMLAGYEWWAIRLAAILLGTGSLVVMYLLGRKLYGARAGFFSALMLLFTPASVAGNFLFTIDSPLILCWVSALLLCWRAIEQPRDWLRWIALALVIGIGTLAKQMMLVFPLLMLGFAIFSKADRFLLRRVPFWLSIGISLCFYIPVVWWNAQHGWITVKHEAEHFQAEQLSALEWLLQLLRFPVLQAVIYSPITWVVMMAALWVTARQWAQAGRRERYLFIFSAPALLVFLGLACRQYVNENWPAVYYLSAFPLGAGLALKRPGWSPWLGRGLITGQVMVAIIYLYIPLIPVLGLQGHRKFDPAVPLRGWDEAARQIDAIYDKEVLRPETTFVIVLDHRHNASQMAFHLPKHPTVYRWDRQGRIESQYEVWPNAADKVGWDAFIIQPDVENDHGGYEKLKPHSLLREPFRAVHKLGDVEVPLGHGQQRGFQIYLAKGMKSWPKSEKDVPPPFEATPSPAAPPP